MKHDRGLVEIFVSEYNRAYGSSYGSPEFPEDQRRNTKEVEAIFTDDAGRRLAIEHTLIQPFMGERDDAFGAFEKVFEPLGRDLSLPIPDYHITLAVPAFGVPKGSDWKEVTQKVRDWFIRERHNFPEDFSRQSIPGLPFPLTLLVEKLHLPGYSGKLTLARTDIPDTFQEVMRKALSEKVPKLAQAIANRKILLLEQNVPVPGIVAFETAIEATSPDCTGFEKIDEIWVVNSVAWKRERVLFFKKAFTDEQGYRERFTYHQ